MKGVHGVVKAFIQVCGHFFSEIFSSEINYLAIYDLV